MTHDQMCPTVNADVPFGLFHDDVPDDCLFCDLIARVRADERERAAERVLALDHWDYCDDHDCRMRQAAAYAIRSVTP